MDIKVAASLRYPKLSKLFSTSINPCDLYGSKIHWTLKEDGSNIGVWRDDNGIYHIRSRNMVEASSDFQKAFFSIPNIIDKLDKMFEIFDDDYNEDVIIYGELCFTGPSPTRIKTHDETKFVVFDVYVPSLDTFVHYMRLHQVCYSAGMPVIELVGVSSHTSTESINEFIDEVLDDMKARGEEGVVGKLYLKDKTIMFKEKCDLPKLHKIKTKFDDGDINLGILDEEDVMSELYKAFDDTPRQQWIDVKIMMPKFARYVAEEAKRSLKRPPSNLFRYYEDEIKERLNEN